MTLRVLLFDDELGRPDSGMVADLARAFRARRIVDTQSDFVHQDFAEIQATGSRGRGGLDDAEIEIHLCTAQVGSPEARRNSLDIAQRALQAGWPFADGTRWALALVDLQFRETGAGSGVRAFGYDLLGLIARTSPELMACIYTSAQREIHESAAVRAGPRQNAGFVSKTAGNEAAELRDALHIHGLLADPAQLLLGQSLPWLLALRTARRRATRRTNLVLGPPGSGKEGLARFLHDSADRGGQFVTRTLHGDTEDIQLLEVFGSESTINAMPARASAFEMASSQFSATRTPGTAFLDELQNCSTSMQQALLAVLEQRSDGRYLVQRIGGQQPHEVDCHSVFASNLGIDQLDERIRSGQFRRDLYDRLQAYSPILLPSLAERREDVPLLLGSFVRFAEGVAGAVRRDIDPSALDATMAELDRRDRATPASVRWLRDEAYAAVEEYPNSPLLLADHLQCAQLRPNRARSGPTIDPAEGQSRAEDSMPAGLAIAPTLANVRDRVAQARENWLALQLSAYEWLWSIHPQRAWAVRSLSGDDNLAGTAIDDKLAEWADAWQQTGLQASPPVAADLAKVRLRRRPGRLS